MTTAVTHQPWCDQASHESDALPYCFGEALGDDNGVAGWWREDDFVLVVVPGEVEVEIPREDVSRVLALLQQAVALRP